MAGEGQRLEAESEVSPDTTTTVLHTLGFREVRREELQRARGGIVNVVYLSSNLVVKIRRRRGGRFFVANCLVSDFADQQKLLRYANCYTRGHPGHIPVEEGRLPVVKTLAYDCFERCDFEVLVMERVPAGLLEDALALDELCELDVQTLVVQLCSAIRCLQELRFESFGMIWLDECFPTYAAFLNAQFEHLESKLVEQRRVQADLLHRVRRFWERHRHVFDDEHNAVLVHEDLHAGNLMHTGARLAAILDFDSALKAAPVANIFSLLKFLERPLGCYNESKYGGRHFLKLIPVLQTEFTNNFDDKFLIRKLNLLNLLRCFDNLDGNEDTLEIERWIKYIIDDCSLTADLNSDDTHFGKILKQYTRTPYEKL